MKTSINPNSIVAGALLRSLPVIALALAAALTYLANVYLDDTNRAAGAILNLRTAAVARAIDAEFVLAIENLKEHESSWNRDGETLAGDEGRRKVVAFMEALHKKDPRFVLSAAAYEGALVRIGEDVNAIPDRMIINLDFFDLPDHGVMSTGFNQANARSTDVWFELQLPNGANAPVIVRTLRRLHDYHSWIRPILSEHYASLFVLRPRQDRGSRILLSGQTDETISILVPEVVPAGNNKPIKIFDETYLTWSTRLRQFPAEVIHAVRAADLKGNRFGKIVAVIVVAFSGLLIAALLLIRFTTRQARFVQDAVSVVTELASGKGGEPIAIPKVSELAALADSLSSLALSVNDSQVSSRILSKNALEMFSCTDAAGAVSKAVELSCTQAGAVTAWFEPFVADQTYYKGQQTIEQRANGWVWKNHRLVQVDKEEALAIQASYPERHTLMHTIKCGHETIGSLKAYFVDGPRDLPRRIFDALGTILEKTLNRQEAIRREVILVTERDFARSVQSSIMASQEVAGDGKKVAQFYRPAERLGREWFHVLQDPKGDGCYLILGGANGEGLSQGIISSGVKGGFEVLDQMLRSGHGNLFLSPTELLPIFERIIRSMSTQSALHITCLVVHVDFKSGLVRAVNKGHPEPIVVRPASEGHDVTPLSEIATRRTEGGLEVFEATLEAGHYLVAFSDGLAGAKGLKSDIFERFMANALRRSTGYKDPEALRNDLKQMYEYYTSGKRQDQDVCFLVVCADQASALTKSA